MIPLSDAAERARFATELDRNFSVRASAGSGKTYAITERILAMARSSHATEWLPQLVVVTFTNRAADEIQQRSRQRLLESGARFEVIAAFDRAFFGTIHSFCVKLLRAHGHALGLPSQCDVITDDGPLWRAFLQKYTRVGASLTEPVRRRLFRHVRVGDILALGRRCAHELRVEAPDDLCEELDCTRLLDHVASRSNAMPKIVRSQRGVREWLDIVRRTDDFAPLPELFGESQAFVAAWNATFAPLRVWLQRAALCAACETAKAFREFRLQRGALNYDDQVALARELLRIPAIARRIREKNYRVILDEAQDTDPEQFTLLAEVARGPDAAGEWPGEGSPPRAGHFCMVGDFQQSIYGSRADLECYRRIHDALAGGGRGDGLTFSVTFRLDEAPLRLVNASFPHILNDAGGQVRFVPLAPRSDILSGQAVRVHISATDSTRDGPRGWHEAKLLAAWIAATGLAKLRAQRWSNVAIICPRKGWFPPLRTALRQAGIAAQLQSEKEIRGDHPAVAWFTALIVVLVEPENAFEIVGVLREVFGISDHDLAEFSGGESARFNLLVPPAGDGPVGDALRLLCTLRAQLEGRALLTQARAIAFATRLRDRLLSLPQDDYEALDETLEDVFTRIAAAEADGLTLSQLAERLREEFASVREARAVQPDAIQVITGHKAKGSEWPVVILPFFARAVKSTSPTYPMIYRDAEGETRVAFSRREMSEDSKNAIKGRAEQEAERLLYVAATRAKHTLVLVDDRELFTNKTDLPGSSQAALFRVKNNDVNVPVLESLPNAAAACPVTTSRRLDAGSRDEGRATMKLPELNDRVLATARERAAHFIKRNPSALAREASADPTKAPDPEALAIAANPLAVRYGTWWHDLMEKLDWANPASWQSCFERAVALSPDADRAAREWSLFMAKVSARPELSGPQRVFHPEMPFLWRTSDRDCIEGIADLVVFDPASARWLVIDWKTNQLRPGRTEKLSEHYRPQLAAYRAALHAMLGAPVSAAIFTTSTGEWVAYHDDELDDAWQEISGSDEAIEAALMA